MMLGDLRRTAAGAAVLALLATPAAAQTTLTFRGSDAIGSLLDRANTMFSEQVTERTGGEVTVNFIAGEQLGTDIDVIQAMMQGSVHVYGDVLGWYSNWVDDFNILNWGFTFDDNDHMQAFLDSDIYAAAAEQLREEQGIRILAAAPTQPRVLFATRAVEHPDDLEGLKMRVPEIRTYLLLWQTLGTQPSRLAWGEIYLGLSTGTIEAAEGPVSAAFAQNLHQVAPHVMRTDHLVSTYHITVHDETFQALSDANQQILIDVAREVTQWARTEAENETDGIVQTMAEQGATIHQIDPGPFAEKALAGVEEMEKEGVWRAGLWQEIRDLRQ
jgi:TRAP-type C4-dicarboxylate transport system substrate-binding protein